MPIMSLQSRYPRPVQAAEMREMMGMPKKLPDNREWGDWTIQGYRVRILSRGALRRLRRVAKPHRIYAQCKACREWLPFGRLAQHEGSARCERAAEARHPDRSI